VFLLLIFYSKVETVNAAYESFDGVNAVYAQPDKRGKTDAASTSAPIYAISTKHKPADPSADVYATVNKDSKKGMR